jgi:hypothetical protein
MSQGKAERCCSEERQSETCSARSVCDSTADGTEEGVDSEEDGREGLEFPVREAQLLGEKRGRIPRLESM